MEPNTTKDTDNIKIPSVQPKESEAMAWLDDDHFDHYWYAEEEYNDYR